MPLWGRVTITVLMFALITTALTFAFVVNVTLPHAAEVPPWYGWGLIALAAAGDTDLASTGDHQPRGVDHPRPGRTRPPLDLADTI